MKTRPYGWGEGYCYIRTRRHLFVCADSLLIARLCCAGDGMLLVRILSYPPNPLRRVYIFR
jgi:hypothetical protein